MSGNQHEHREKMMSGNQHQYTRNRRQKPETEFRFVFRPRYQNRRFSGCVSFLNSGFFSTKVEELLKFRTSASRTTKQVQSVRPKIERHISLSRNHRTSTHCSSNQNYMISAASSVASSSLSIYYENIDLRIYEIERRRNRSTEIRTCLPKLLQGGEAAESTLKGTPLSRRFVNG